MPTEYIREQILANIQTTLQGVTTAGGYFFNLNGSDQVQRWSQHGQDLSGTLPVVIVIPGDEEELAGPDPLVTLNLPVYLAAYYTHAKSDAVKTDTHLSRLIGDIKKVIQQDYTRGGLAVDTNVLGSTPFEAVEGQPFCGVIVEVEIKYQHQRLNPATII